MSKEKMMRFYFISDEDAKEYMEKNHINGSSSQYNVKIYPDYSKEHVTYYNREDLIMSIVEKVNNNEITKGCKTNDTKSKYITYTFKEKSNKDSNIIYELIIPKKLLNDRGNYLNDKILDLGCGEGRDSIYLLDKGYNLLAVDYSTNVINKCNFLSKNKYINNFKQYDILCDKSCQQINCTARQPINILRNILDILQ